MDKERRVERDTELERIVFFSDAVFAIAITLLVLEIRVPEGLSPTALIATLGGMWPRFASYLISFSLIGGFWRAHHRIFHYIEAYDQRLITLNLAFLMCVAFLPFSASLFGEYAGLRVAVEVYAGSIAVAGLFLGGMWWYATRRGRLTEANLDPRLIRQVMTERLSPPVISLAIALTVLFFGVTAALYALLPLLLIQLVVEKILPRLRAR
jgi:uncharacterized membrane protein